ncbi:MAG TPA: metal-dependent hydrolase [Paenibacillaceae bacterium]|nr:metal-dependent hydrolase [Paenibacillaceae bacterium]
MDTGTHILIGVSLAGLATLDPGVAQNPFLTGTILMGTVIGSHAPDFDTITRMKSYNLYLRTHRGISHSLPALLLWPALLTLALTGITGYFEEWFILYRWIFIAVFLHVGLDLLNSYGVQCMRPFSKKWYHLDILSIFEPFLFFLHLTGICLWFFLMIPPKMIFPLVYGISGIYIVFRTIHHFILVRRVKMQFAKRGKVHVFPTFQWFHWQFVVEQEDRFYTGKIELGKLTIEEILTREERNPIIEATLSTDGVRTFLSFAQRVHVTCHEITDGYEVKWSDVRFWHNRKLPFGVDVKLDRDLKVVSSHLGWRKKYWDPPYL